MEKKKQKIALPIRIQKGLIKQPSFDAQLNLTTLTHFVPITMYVALTTFVLM